MPTPPANTDTGLPTPRAVFDQRVTAVVPARNEERVIEACVRSLARQPEIAHIIVVDDQSTDQTAEVVRGLMPAIANLRLLEAPDVPVGWSGKNHALWEGAQGVGTPWILFTDADAELLEAAVAHALRIAEEKNAALVSFSPEQITRTWYENALVPFVYTRLARYFSYDAVNDDKSEAAAANGQFLMIRKDVYAAIGGHEAVAADVLEDVALAKRAKAAGYRIWFGSGAGVIRVRMYRSFGAMWEGWKKNLYLLVGGNPRAVYRELVSVVPWIPFVLLFLGLKTPIAFIAGLGLLVARHAVYASTLLRNQFRVKLILYYVPAALLYAGVLWASYRAHTKGVVEWKGRRISLKATV